MSKSYAMTLDFAAAVEDGCLSLAFLTGKSLLTKWLMDWPGFTRRFSQPVCLIAFPLAGVMGLLDAAKSNASQLCKLRINLNPRAINLGAYCSHNIFSKTISFMI
jgi:hypothetical protein